MAGFDPQIVTGQPTLTQAPTMGSGANIGARLASAVQPQHGLIAIVLFSVAVLLLLDRAGFRFAVTVGRS